MHSRCPFLAFQMAHKWCVLFWQWQFKCTYSQKDKVLSSYFQMPYLHDRVFFLHSKLHRSVTGGARTYHHWHVGANWQGSWRCCHLFASLSWTLDMRPTEATRALTLATVSLPTLVAPSLAFSWASLSSRMSRLRDGKGCGNWRAALPYSFSWVLPSESILQGHGGQRDWYQVAIVQQSLLIVTLLGF